MTKPASKSKRRLVLTTAMKAKICREVSLGKSLRRVLRPKTMPSLTKVLSTLQEDTIFAGQYARARRCGIELHVDGLLDLADSANAENSQAVRLRVDTRKWIASKILPKIYGDRVGLDLSGDGRMADTPAPTLIEAARRVAWIMRAGAEAVEKERQRTMLRLAPPIERVINPDPLEGEECGATE